MKKVMLIMLLLLPLQAMAARDYQNGTYWTVTGVDTKPGMYNEYIADLKNVWLKSVEMLIKDGKALSYRMFSNVHARQGEPDLYLMIEWKSAGDVLDTSDEYWDTQEEKLFGSVDKGVEATVKRGDLRTIMSESLLRELSFK
jgi:hypothetical protein